MIISILAAQLGFGIALPNEGPLAPYRDCVVQALARLPVERLRGGVAGAVDAECSRVREAGMTGAIEAAVARSARAGLPITRETITSYLPTLLGIGVAGAVDNELRARGIDPYPPSRLPPIEVPRLGD